MNASVDTPNTWEKYLVIDGGDGTIALKSLKNNKYVSATDGTGHPLYAVAESVNSWEKFKWTDRGNGKIALFSPQWNTYVSVDPGDAAGSLKASFSGSNPDTWEYFGWACLP